MRGCFPGVDPESNGGRVTPLVKIVLLAWLVLGPVGIWLRRRRRSRR
jgi:hypothetical protein